MNRKVQTIDNASEIGNRVQGYLEALETERLELRGELELARTHHNDLDKALALAERRAEIAEHERDTARAQRDDALQKLIALTTLWGSIKTTVGQGEAMITQTAGSIKQSLRGVPTRNGSESAGPPDQLGAGIAKLADGLKVEHVPAPPRG
jgi:chromosome segregation ATPase